MNVEAQRENDNSQAEVRRKVSWTSLSPVSRRLAQLLLCDKPLENYMAQALWVLGPAGVFVIWAPWLSSTELG